MVTWFCVCSVSAWRTLMVLSDPTTMINYCGIIYYNNSVPCKRAWSSLTHEKKLKFNAKISGSTVCHYPAGIAGEVHIYMLGVPSSTLPPLPPLPTPTPTPQKSWYHNTCFLQWQRMLWQSLVVSLWPSKEVWGHAPLDILTPREYLWDLLTINFLNNCYYLTAHNWEWSRHTKIRDFSEAEAYPIYLHPCPSQ